MTKKRKTDIQLIEEAKVKMALMTEEDSFQFMRSKNLPQWQAPWEWDKTYKIPCSRCGSDTIYERKQGCGNVLRLTQCTSAVRYYSVIREADFGYAIYGENYGVMRLEEDSFFSKQHAIEWLKANKHGSEALANWEVHSYEGKPPLTRPISK